jgi:ketosteroid isomerase-like protein
LLNAIVRSTLPAFLTIKSTGRVYRQNYVVFLRAAGGKIVFLREYFDPVRAAKAMNLPIAGLAS